MSYVALIVKADFSAIGVLPAGLDPARLDPIIRKSQEVDLQPLLGRAFYSNIMANVAGAEYIKLISGTTYADANGDPIDFPGLKMVLLNYTWARFLPLHKQTITSQGLVEKTNPYSVPVEQKALSASQAEYRGDALKYWSDVVDYLNANDDVFTLWKNTADAPSGSLRFNALGGRGNKCSTRKKCSDNDGYYENGYISSTYYQ